MKPKLRRSDAPVQGTNDNSIVSKCSMAGVGYFDDNFLTHFVSKNSRRSPLINRGYYIRAKAIDFALKMFLNSKPSDKKQVISLGAGFDSSYFRLKDKGTLSKTRFLEIDFPDVVRRKAKLIHATKELSTLINDAKYHFDSEFQGEITSNGYSLVGCDLTDLNRLDKVIDSVQFNRECPTLLLSEVVLTYVNKESCSKLIRWAAETFSNSIFLLYEQIRPDDAFGIIMKKHFTTLQSPLQCVDSYPTRAAQIDRFKSLGWEHCHAIDMNEFYYDFITKEERERVSNIEVFDEFEEWHLKCAHYILLGAFCGSCCSIEDKIFPGAATRIFLVLALTTIYKTAGYDHPWLPVNFTVVFAYQFENPNSLSKRSITGRVSLDVKRKRCGGEKEPVSLLPSRRANKTEESLKRFGHQLVKLAENKILSACGFGCSQNRHQRLRDCSIIEFREDNESSHIVHSFQLFESSRLFHSLVKLSDGSIFVFGGRESPLKPCLDYGIFRVNEKHGEQCYDHTSSEIHLNSGLAIFNWKDKLSPHSSYEQERTEPYPRWRHSATTVSIKGKECVLIFGGRNEHYPALSDCWVFYVAERNWQKINLQTDSGVIEARHSHSACRWGDDKIIITGGLNADSQPLNLVDILHLSSEGFHLETVKSIEQLPARYSHTSHTIDDQLWVVGGVDLSIPSDVLMISLRDWKWTEHLLQAEGSSPTSEPIMLHNHASTVRNDKEIIILGGGGNCFSFGTHFNAGIICIDVSNKLL